MPPKPKPAAVKKPTTGAAKAPAKAASNKAVAKKATGPAAKKSDPKTNNTKAVAKPAVKKWTKEDDAAAKIQRTARGFIARQSLKKMKKEKGDYEELMLKLEKEACIAIALQYQKEAEEQTRKQMEERKRKAEEKKRVKRMLEAGFDGDLDEINAILKEVKDLDNKSGVGNDLIGEATRAKHLMNMVECEDAHGNTPLSEASSGGHADTVKYLMELGADPNSRGQFNRTPMYRAAFAGHLDCCEALLLHGADPRLYAEDGQTPENVASMDAVKELFGDWDVSKTDALMSKIETEKEKRREQEKAKREAEMSEIDRELEDVQKEYDAHQKTLNSLYCDLNKRIDEHDNAPAMGFEKPEITLQSIKDAEDKLEIAKIDYERSKEKIRQLKLKKQEKVKQEIQADGLELAGVQINIRELHDVLFRDVGNKIKDSGMWPMIIDPTNQVSTFLRYQDTNYLNALAPKNMEAEIIRLAVIGAIRYGKPLVVDMMEVDMYQTVSDRMDEVLPGLLSMIMDKSILKEENYLKLVKPSDGDAYLKQNFNGMRLDCFKLFILTKNIFPSEYLMDNTYVIRLHIPE